MSHRLCLVVALLSLPAFVGAADLPKVEKVERQPLSAQAKRVTEALAFLGEPLSAEDVRALELAAGNPDQPEAIAALQAILDKRCVVGVKVLDDKKLEILPGPAKLDVVEQGWRCYLVKVYNPKGVDKLELQAVSPNAVEPSRSSNKPDPTVLPVSEITKRFLDIKMFDSPPMTPTLDGLEVEYRIVQVYCRDAGRKEFKLGFGLAKPRIPKNQPYVNTDLLPFTVESPPAVIVKLRVADFDGKPTTGCFTFRDSAGRVYPSQSRRLAPDFFFHAQVYRADGETILLQPGKYIVQYTRGPEYLVESRTITVPKAASHTESFELKRWIHMTKKGWWSGDHHIHAAGCSHYDSPTEGVTPEDMMRHILGEDLNVGCCLSWGPCWYHQKRYFEGKINKLSTPTHILRYDVEVSGFPSSHAGHICLLRLRDQDYPGTKLVNDWPSWDLPIFRWAKDQGGVVGFAHSGWGLELIDEDAKHADAFKLPNFLMPKMTGIGANEYIVDIVHGACDFISTVDTPSVQELNIWYHTLNCGYRCRISGETDFPCIYGERVGLGRSYVKLGSKLDFDEWCEGIKDGKCYVSEGRCHLFDFTLNGLGVGEKKSEVQLKEPGKVKIKAAAAAWLEPKPTPVTERIRKAPLNAKPYWDIERSRIEETRKVPVELIVNGYPVATKEIVADGTEQEVEFEVKIEASSWVCLRVLPAAHTNPIFVVVDGKPIRASKKSAEWCIKATERCWTEKTKKIRAEEQEAAKAAYDKALDAYRKIARESKQD